MREGGGGDYIKYLKRGWNRKEGKGNKKIKKGGQAGSRGGCLNKEGLESPYKPWPSLNTIFNILLNAQSNSFENMAMNRIKLHRIAGVSILTMSLSSNKVSNVLFKLTHDR